jgi:RNA-directed DNA polymerase
LIRSKIGSRFLRGGGSSKSTHTYEDIISVENLLAAWREFLRGKRKKRDVQKFQHCLMDNILSLHRDLVAGTYRHGGYKHFKIADPKPRDIHKASVRDRLLHHAIYRKLYPFFDKKFIADSYSCRVGKGTHKAMNRFRSFAYKASRNYTRTCWILKCDVRKFFASIDHEVLMSILMRYVQDKRILGLLSEVISSFDTHCHHHPNSKTVSFGWYVHTGLPLGNLTSQLLVNVYMNEFDQYVKHSLEAKYYIRYADDFVIVSHDKKHLKSLLLCMAGFLNSRLKLELHPDKVFIKTLASGVDFLGWVHFSDHRILRTSTKRRMLKKVENSSSQETWASYRGLLSHGNAYRLSRKLHW